MRTVFVLLSLSLVLLSFGKKKEEISILKYGTENSGTTILIKFEKGKAHNHPLFAIWLADKVGNYLQTLYVSQSVGKGYYSRVDRNAARWVGGEIQHPATLPYWAHQRNILNKNGTYMPTPSEPVPDAYTGATPQNSFELYCITEQKLKGKYQVYLELNQTWDWNEYWTNDKYPNDKEYSTSCQPALIYVATIDTDLSQQIVTLRPIGHSHYSGANGEINTDLSTITSALGIAKRITVEIK